MYRTWQNVRFGGLIAAVVLATTALPAMAQQYYDDPDLQYRNLPPRPEAPAPPAPPAPPPTPPGVGPACRDFPHDFRVSGAKWHLFSPTYKAFPVWSGYNDTYPRGTGSEYFFIRPGNVF
jgi:hypothetical protein